MSAPRSQLAVELLRRFAAALRSAQLYSKGHPIVGRNLEGLLTAAEVLHRLKPSIAIGLVENEVIVDDTPMAGADALGPIVARLKDAGIERITIDRGVTSAELAALIDAVIAVERAGDKTTIDLPGAAHIRVGRVAVEQPGEAGSADMATIKRLYGHAVSTAGDVWESAETEGTPDATIARSMVDGLAHAVAQNRTALLALTTLRNYDNYTFTHMVNVSILAMGQARGLGIDGPLLRELGLAALMHDIGKVRTPLDILNKPEALTESEMAVIKRHPVDGAEMLRKTPDIPALAPVVAFEHHYRLDGTGYPDGATRASLNVGTVICAIADVYDAMRSQRAYKGSSPTDRILAVLKENDGRLFDPHLVRRFVQLVGIYPAGNLVRLNTGEIAVVLKVNALDPHRPQVRVLLAQDGSRLESSYDCNLWGSDDDPAGPAGLPSSIVAPLDPDDYGIDPLLLI